MMFTKDDLIFAYTRQQAIADGVLVDVTETAKQAGFAFPVALTQGVWAECVAVPKDDPCQDEAGRLWDVLCMLRFAARKSDSEEIRYSLYVQKEPDGGPELVTLRAVCGPDDDGSPCITVMLPHED